MLALPDDLPHRTRVDADPEVEHPLLRADGKNHTASSARASLCYYLVFSPSNVGDAIYPPSPLRDPKLTREYRDILAEADSRLAGGHRAHAAVPGNSQDSGGSGKLAMK